MTGWLHDPIVQAVVLPLAAALLFVGLLRVLGGVAVASAGVGLAFLLAYLVIAGMPLYPPRSSEHKMVYLVAAGLTTGLVVDWLRLTRPLSWVLAALFPVAAILWLTPSRVLIPPDLAFAVPAAISLLAGWAVTMRLDRLRGAASAPALMLLVAAAAAAVISHQGGSLKYAMLFAALAAASGGHLLWNWPLTRHPSGVALILGGGGAFVVMSMIVSLYALTDLASRLALALLAAIFFMDRVVPAGARPGALAPLLLFVPCAAVAVVAVMIAWLG